MATPREVAEFMAKHMGDDWMYQEDIVYRIQSEFGDEFVYQNDNGNLAIDKRVLHQFRKLTEDSVVWERGYRAWRPRQAGDPAGRQVDY